MSAGPFSKYWFIGFSLLGTNTPDSVDSRACCSLTSLHQSQNCCLQETLTVMKLHVRYEAFILISWQPIQVSVRYQARDHVTTHLALEQPLHGDGTHLIFPPVCFAVTLRWWKTLSENWICTENWRCNTTTKSCCAGGLWACSHLIGFILSTDDNHRDTV